MSMLLVGESHLRDIFYRMGLSDKDIVALSGAHTLVILLSCIYILLLAMIMARNSYFICVVIREEHIQRDQGLMALGQRIL